MKLETGNSKIARIRPFALGFCLSIFSAAVAEERRLTSPDGAVQAVVYATVEGQLAYTVLFHGREVVAESPIGMRLNGFDLGKVGALTAMSVREVNERYPARGVHAVARFDALQMLYNVQPQIGPSFGLQVTVSNEGFAWRLIVPGKSMWRVEAETACWRLPPESRVWFFWRPSDGWTNAPLNDLNKASPQGLSHTLDMPLVAELPQERGYAVVAEAALSGYSGLRLQAESDGALRGVFAEKEGFAISGNFQTPWRVVLLAPTLDALVNSDFITSLNLPPDPTLFGTFDWMRGGRSVWSGVGGDAATHTTVADEKQVIDCAARLNFEFTTLDERWEAWTNAWDTLKEVCGYGRERNVRVFVGKDSKKVNLPENNWLALREYLDRVQAAGAAGVKIDGLNGEDLGLIVFEERVSREAALRKLMVNFNGCRKASGESRTYPNGFACETDVAGHADGAALAFSHPGNTTWAHRLAAAYLMTSPLLVMTGPPQRLLDEPRLAAVIPFLQALPVTWDETRVLDGSRIGEFSAFARRTGNVWYVAMVNGTANMKLVSFSPGFTGWRQARLSQFTDGPGKADELVFSSRVVSGETLQIVTLEPGGGFVAKLERE